MQSLSPRLGFLWSAVRVQAGVSGEVLRMRCVAKRKEGGGVCITPTLQPVPVTFPASAHASSMLQALRVNPLVPGLKPCKLLPSPCHAHRALHDRLCARTMAAAHSFLLSEDSWSSASCRCQAHNLGDKRRRSSVSVLGQGVQGASLRLHETCVCLSRGMEGSGESECGVPLQPLTSLVFGETGTPAGFEQETDRTCLDCN